MKFFNRYDYNIQFRPNIEAAPIDITNQLNANFLLQACNMLDLEAPREVTIIICFVHRFGIYTFVPSSKVDSYSQRLVRKNELELPELDVQ